VQDPPSAVVDREPDEQQSKPNGRNDEEVHPGDYVLVIPKERHPSLLLVRVRIGETSYEFPRSDSAMFW
jgi:hypothetical protein